MGARGMQKHSEVLTGADTQLATLSFQYIDAQRTLADFNESEKQEVLDFQELQSKTGWRWKQAQVWMVLDYPGTSRLALVCPERETIYLFNVDT